VLAVLFNIVILAGVLATAHQISQKKEAPFRENVVPAVVRGAEDKEFVDRYAPQEEGAQSFDEIDQLLEEYISEEIPATQPEIAQTNDAKKPVKSKTKVAKTKELPLSDEYYIVKAGDNPWKIAKRFHLSFERLLLINHLDEAKARNLKIGQKLRIREQTQ
jgi:LysM repeat protein